MLELFRLGKAKGIEREIKPSDFDEDQWLADTEAHLSLKRPALVLEDLKNKEDARRAQILRRQAINYYFLNRKQMAVKSDRLAALVAAFPTFVQSSFEQYPPDEAQRRLTIVYRLVFPPGEEMKPVLRQHHRPPGGPGSTPGTSVPRLQFDRQVKAEIGRTTTLI